jgi:hypothetical protein
MQLDHLTIPCKDRHRAARTLALLLGVDWGPAAIGPFTAVYVNDGLTIDFDEWAEAYLTGLRTAKSIPRWAVAFFTGANLTDMSGSCSRRAMPAATFHWCD